MKRLSLLALAGTVALVPVLGASAQSNRLTAAAPDLVPIPSRIEHGVVSVRNVGTADAGPLLVRVTCQRAGGGSCAEGRGMAAYENPAYPNSAVVEVPNVPAGHVHNHTLTFWNNLAWQPGTYNFVIEVDAGWDVAETNEGNNFGGHPYVVP